MIKDFVELIQNNKVILNLSNCPCCLGTLARGKVLKEKFPGIILTASSGLPISKKQYFPYSLVTQNFKELIIREKVSLVIHDFRINYDLYNTGIQLKIPQYLIYINQEFKYQIEAFKWEKIIFPYPEKKNKYKIGNQPVMIVSLSSGGWFETEKVFQYAYGNFSEEFDLIFIYGIFYQGKKFEDVKASIFEENIIELFSLANTVVTFGSYNTMAELITLNKNLIAIPRKNNPTERETARFAKYFPNIKILNL